jgi:hypothetical protein
MSIRSIRNRPGRGQLEFTFETNVRSFVLANEEKVTSFFRYNAGQARDMPRDFEFCKDRSFALVSIEDPFATKTPRQYNLLKRFIEKLFLLMSKPPEKVELRTRHESNEEQKLMLMDMEKWLKRKGAAFVSELVPIGSDFHDRQIIFHLEPINVKKEISVLLTGALIVIGNRGLDARFL